jgi:hypothetical protein
LRARLRDNLDKNHHDVVFKSFKIHALQRLQWLVVSLSVVFTPKRLRDDAATCPRPPSR